MSYQARGPLRPGLPQKKKQKKSKKLWVLCAVSVVFVAAAVVTALELTNTTHFFHHNVSDDKVIVSAGKQPAKTPVTPSTTTTSPDVEKTPATTNGVNNGTATDNHGAASSNTNSKQWVVSKSGNITVKQPVADSTIKPGAVVAGSAKVSQVQYRLIDNETGVIGQGPLSVVDGNFSGALQFQAHSSGGRLDVFSVDASGAEINEVQLTVAF